MNLGTAPKLPGEISGSTSAPPLYAQVASHYRHAIQSGTKVPGSRMPSVRALMGLHRVSLTTAQQARTVSRTMDRAS
jgi:DNA-binding transcriptional regulator YhcF (GntR family)